MSKKRYLITSTAYDRRGRVLSVGENNYRKSSTWQKELSIACGYDSERIYLHSEIACLLKTKGKQVHSLFVERYDSEGKPKLAFPCKSCQLGIKLAGVKEVRFTSEEGIKTWIVG